MRDLRDVIRLALRQQPEIPEHTRIAAERELAQLSASHCARAFGCSHTIWQRIEDGSRALTCDERVRVARILGVTVARLRGRQVLIVPGRITQGRPVTRKAAA